MDNTPILEMKGISKRFSGIQALDHVDYCAYPGKINVLMGENGAGKSTLMRVLAGAHPMDEGEIFINGNKIHITSPTDAINNEIAMIYQELNLIDEMMVYENIFLGHEISRGSFIDKKTQIRETQKLMDELNFDIRPTDKIIELSTAKRQMVEIIKAIHLNARIIIMDEPTSSLAENEVKVLFQIMRRLKDQGVCIIFISHRMEEVLEIGDYITIMRDGKKVGDWPARELTREQIISHMVGREVKDLFEKETVPIGGTVLEVKNLEKKGVFHDISFNVHAGEILGFSGLMGAGRSEVMKAVFGELPYDSGEIFINGEKVTIKNPGEAMEKGIGFVPEDRKNLGLNLLDTVEGNMSVTILNDVSKLSFINFQKMHHFCQDMIDKLRIKTRGLNQGVSTLSGGNQQKVVIGKWLQRKSKIMIMDEPTRGVDVGAKAEIHRLIIEMAREGTAVILVSSELPEIMGMVDRVVVMCEGAITGELMRDEMTQERIMDLATATL